MREILFRGKATNRIKGYEYRTNYKNGDWVYGLITKLYDERFENLPAKMTDIDGISGIDVDYKTIGQYTGLTDKNGTKIFEGDILYYPTILNHKLVTGIVIFSKDEFCFNLDIKKERDNTLFEQPLMYLSMYDCEVIGNIYDNLELLGGAEE